MDERKKVRVAIIGVGNCASALVQGVEFYKNAKNEERVPGLYARQPGRVITFRILNSQRRLTSWTPRWARTFRRRFTLSRTTHIALRKFQK